MGAPRPLEDRVRECLIRHPDWPTARISSSIHGASRGMINAIRAGNPVPSQEGEVKDNGTIALDVVKKRYDISAAIKIELGKLKAGSLLAERELCLRTAGKDRNRFKRAVDNTEEFVANRVKLRLGEDTEGQWFWGSPYDVAEAKRLRDE